MQPSPVSSFFRFLLGFLTFISVSFGVTYGVNVMAQAKDAAQHAAAAKAIMLEQDTN
ncbi:MAG: hypothetical protein JO019_03555 [Candidatus Kaiserbacteria bacterium]|nr:hypothetical protein [Candidatus Kaiserbacteria bacterium]